MKRTREAEDECEEKREGLSAGYWRDTELLCIDMNST